MVSQKNMYPFDPGDLESRNAPEGTTDSDHHCQQGKSSSNDIALSNRCQRLISKYSQVALPFGSRR